MHRRSFLRLLGIATVAATLTTFGRWAAPLAEPEWAPLAPIEDSISIRFVRKWEMQMVSRVDVLYGYSVLNPEFAVRVTPRQSLADRLSSWLGGFLKAA